MSTDMRADMRRDLVAALKSRNRVEITVLRSALAALENAEAPDVLTGADGQRSGHGSESGGEHVAGAVVGVGATERPRLELDDDQVRAVLEHEIAERTDAVEVYLRAGRPEQARELQVEAEMLRRYLPQAG